MKTMIEFFSGSGVMAEAFKREGYMTLTIDKDVRADLIEDILYLNSVDIRRSIGFRKADVLWFGVPCQCFSMAGSSDNFVGFMPTKVKSCIALALVYKCFDIIEEMQPKSWFIENPMGYLRKFPIMQGKVRKEAWYCQYGDKRAKPTDIWTNRVEWIPKRCRNNNTDCGHEKAPRGSRTGTQGLKNAYERGVYPQKFCEEVVDVCEGRLKEVQRIL